MSSSGSSSIAGPLAASTSALPSRRSSHRVALSRSSIDTVVPRSSVDTVVPRRRLNLILQLPVELILAIFEEVAFPDILRMALVCNRFLHICVDNVPYIIERALTHVGLQLTRPAPIPSPGPARLTLPSSVLDDLLRTNHGLRYMQNTNRRSYGVVTCPSNVMAICDGFLLHMQDNRILRYQGFCSGILLYARSSPGPVLNWHVWFPAPEVWAVAIDPCLDLVTVLAPIEDPTPVPEGMSPPPRRFRVLFRKLSDLGSVHPYSGGDVTFGTRLDVNIPRRATTSRLLPALDLLLMYLAEITRHPRGWVGLVNWHDGEASLIILQVPDGALDVAWLTLWIFVITARSGSIYVYRVVSRSPLVIHLMAVLWLPDLDMDLRLDIFSAVTSMASARSYDGLPGVPSTYESSFAADNGISEPSMRSDPTVGLLVLTLVPSQNAHDVPESAYTSVHRLSDILAIFSDSNWRGALTCELLDAGAHESTFVQGWRIVSSDRWFDNNSRLFRNFDLNDYTHAVVGSHMLSSCGVLNPLVASAMTASQFGTSAASDDVILLSDFSPTTAPERDTSVGAQFGVASSLEGAGAWRRVGGMDTQEREVAHATIVSPSEDYQRVFDEDVVSTLPYRQTVSSPQGSISFSGLDESRIWLMSWFMHTQTVFWDVRVFHRCD